MPRRLTSRVRVVASPGRAAYDAAWEALRREAVSLGAHAWRFTSTILPDRYLEFLEFADDADPRQRAPVSAALAALDLRFPAPPGEEWVELSQNDQ